MSSIDKIPLKSYYEKGSRILFYYTSRH